MQKLVLKQTHSWLRDLRLHHARFPVALRASGVAVRLHMDPRICNVKSRRALGVLGFGVRGL